jgi:hypothetical protein
MEKVGIFNAMWNIKMPFGTFYGHSVLLWQFGIYSPILVYCVQEKSGNPGELAAASLFLSMHSISSCTDMPIHCYRPLQ